MYPTVTTYMISNEWKNLVNIQLLLEGGVPLQFNACITRLVDIVSELFGNEITRIQLNALNLWKNRKKKQRKEKRVCFVFLFLVTISFITNVKIKLITKIKRHQQQIRWYCFKGYCHQWIGASYLFTSGSIQSSNLTVDWYEPVLIWLGELNRPYYQADCLYSQIRCECNSLAIACALRNYMDQFKNDFKGSGKEIPQLQEDLSLETQSVGVQR